MRSLENLDGTPLQQRLGYKVVSQDGEMLGVLRSLWSDPETGKVEFLAVETDGLFWRDHVVTAENVEWDETAQTVLLPYAGAFIKEAPSVLPYAEISETDAENIHRYYGTENAAQAGASRWRRTSQRGETGTEAAPGADVSDPHPLVVSPAIDLVDGASAGGAVRAAMDDLFSTDPSGSRQPTTRTAPGAHGTANLFGSTGINTSVSADALGVPVEPGTVDSTNSELPQVGSANINPLTGAPGSHPVGAGVGALGAGLAGAAIGGAVAGPIGAPVGAVIGAIVGGLAGKGIAESIIPTDEEAYWRANLHLASYFRYNYDFSDYEPAFKAGYEGYRQATFSGRSFDEMEAELRQDFEQIKGASRLNWDEAKAAALVAWTRAEAKAAANKLE